MPDRLTVDARRALMSRIGAKDTKPEMVVRRMLHALGYRYVLHDRRLPGKPDLVFPARRKVILVHGCFWHGHSCGRGFRPVANADFWETKIVGNQARDTVTEDALRRLRWDVLTVWECQTRLQVLPTLQQRLVSFLNAPFLSCR